MSRVKAGALCATGHQMLGTATVVAFEHFSILAFRVAASAAESLA